MAASFGDLVGTWSGTNGFRMMPTDAMVDGPATAQLATPAGGYDVVLTYTWVHLADGPQDGVLFVGSPEDGQEEVTAAWGDSWHQKPALLALAGTRVGARLDVAADYGGGWGWTISLQGGEDGRLILTMHNVIPAEYATADAPAGPYPVMHAELARTALTEAVRPGRGG